MKTISKTQVLRDYKIILRHIRKLPSSQASNSTPKPISSFAQIVKEMYNTGRKETNEKVIALHRSNARSYAMLVSSVSELKYLKDLDTGEKLNPRDKIMATAARVGLGVPQVEF